MKDEKKDNTEWDLDQVLKELKFGLYQIKNLILIGFFMMFANLFPLSFSLTAADLQYRCLIPECETPETGQQQFMPSWIRAAIPFRDNEHWKCRRYKPFANSTNGNHTDCPVSFSSVEEDCEKKVFATDEVTIANEFGILCENRRWQLSMIGTVNNLGQFFGIPLFGVVSDWYGRKSVVIICSLMSAIFGICRGYSVNYTMFAICEFMDSFFGGAIYSTAFVMGIELVAPKKRPLAVMAVQLFYPFGAAFMGCVAWYFKNWRKVLIFSYSPGLLFVFYFWLIPESVRWLHIKGRYAETNTILKKMAETNRVTLPEKCFEGQMFCTKSNSSEKGQQSVWKSIATAFQTRSIFLRLLSCSWCWFAVNLVYYGISMNSVELVGHKYINFILISLVEIPAVFLSATLLKKIDRRISQSSAFILSGLACILSEFIPPKMLVLKMCIYLASKLLITTSFSIIYVYSAEMFPTDLRSSLSGIVSTVGRIGSMIAPHTVLCKMTLGRHAPALIFGIIAISAGALATTFPETSNKNLQDTMGETQMKDDLQIVELKKS